MHNHRGSKKRKATGGTCRMGDRTVECVHEKLNLRRTECMNEKHGLTMCAGSCVLVVGLHYSRASQAPIGVHIQADRRASNPRARCHCGSVWPITRFVVCLLAYAVQLISQLANLCFGFLKHHYATVIRIVLGHVSRSHTGQNFAEIHCLRSVRIVELPVLIGIKDFTRCSSLPFSIKNKILTHRRNSAHG